MNVARCDRETLSLSLDLIRSVSKRARCWSPSLINSIGRLFLVRLDHSIVVAKQPMLIERERTRCAALCTACGGDEQLNKPLPLLIGYFQFSERLLAHTACAYTPTVLHFALNTGRRSMLDLTVHLWFTYSLVN